MQFDYCLMQIKIHDFERGLFQSPLMFAQGFVSCLSRVPAPVSAVNPSLLCVCIWGCPWHPGSNGVPEPINPLPWCPTKCTQSYLPLERPLYSNLAKNQNKTQQREWKFHEIEVESECSEELNIPRPFMRILHFKILLIQAWLMWVQENSFALYLLMQKSQELQERCRQKQVWYKNKQKY